MGNTTQLTQQALIEHDLENARFVFYQNIAVAEGKEGIHVNSKKAKNALRLAKEVYGNEIPFIYISNRINSFSIDLIGYYEAIKKFPNLKAYAIVTQNKKRRRLAVLEKFFSKKPIRVFDNLDSAMHWAERIIIEKN
jgi:hypothetical protein